MKLSAVLGLVALIPAACNVPAAAARILALPLCAGEARVLMIPMPFGKGQPDEPSPCCTKGCHAGCRKRGQLRQIDR